MDEEEVVETLYETILLNRHLERWVAQARTSGRQLSFTGKVVTEWEDATHDTVTWGRKWWVVFYRLKRAGQEAV